MIVLENSFSMFAGIESFLKKATSSKISSFSFGLLTTAIMQSSGLVSVLAISFLSAGLISLISGLAIITFIFINFFIFITDETAKIAGVRDDDYTIKLAIFIRILMQMGFCFFIL